MAAASGDEEAVMSCLAVDTRFAREKDGNGVAALCLAVFNGHEGVVRILLDAGVGTECSADDPRPAALSLARAHQRHGIIELLTSRSAAILPQNETRTQEFLQGAKERNIQLVRRCLEEGVAIEAADSTGRTALGWAVDNRDEEMTKLLLLKGAIVNGTSLLSAAAKWGNAGVFGVLLEKTLGPRINTFREIMLDLESQHEDILQLVVRKWLEVDAGSRLSWRGTLSNAVTEGREAAVRVLLDNGAYIGATGLPGQDKVNLAAEQGHVGVLRLLLERRTDINERDRISNSALYYAVWYGRLEAVHLLLDRGADINMVDKEGRNALHLAAKKGSLEIVRLLLERGVKIDMDDSAGKSALHHASYWGRLEVVQLLLEQGAKIDMVDKEGMNALHLAAMDGSLGIVRLLLERGAKIDMVDKEGRNALHLAAKKGSLEIVRLLLERGVKIDMDDSVGKSALHHASYWGRLEVVQLLLEQGAKIDMVDKEGRNALHLAAMDRSLGIIRLLLERGADRQARTKKGEKPSELVPFRNIELMLLLE
jgi:ankyrin repeat protein